MRRILAVALLAPAVIVAGCGNEQEPEVEAPAPVLEAPPSPPLPSVLDAVAESDAELLEQLVADGQPIDVLSDEGLSALQLAVMKNDSAMVARLLELGLDADGAPSRGMPPLNLAIDLVSETDASEDQRATGLRILELLIRHGANPTAHLNSNNSAVQHAMDRQCEDCVTLIRELAFATGVD